jgi:hypothetical protein
MMMLFRDEFRGEGYQFVLAQTAHEKQMNTEQLNCGQCREAAVTVEQL